MLKDLEEKFKLHCESERLEVNQNQIKVIRKIQNYFNQNFTSSLLKTLFVKNSAAVIALKHTLLNFTAFPINSFLIFIVSFKSILSFLF